MASVTALRRRGLVEAAAEGDAASIVLLANLASQQASAAHAADEDLKFRPSSALVEVLDALSAGELARLWADLDAVAEDFCANPESVQAQLVRQQEEKKQQQEETDAFSAARKSKPEKRVHSEWSEPETDEENDDEEEKQYQETVHKNEKGQEHGVFAGEETQPQLLSTSLPAFLRALARLAAAHIVPGGGRAIPASLRSVAARLHDALLPLSSSGDEGEEACADEILKLCEEWWQQQLPGATTMVPAPVCILVSRALMSDRAVDVERVWRFRTALMEVEVVAPESEDLRNMLLRAFVLPQFVRTSKGQQLLVFLMNLHQGLIPLIHDTVKGQIPHAPRATLEAFGDVYFRAWRSASGAVLPAIEYSCLQDLANCAIRAQRVSVIKGCRTILSRVHAKKKLGGVDEMLLRLYSPILWRALDAANPVVRSNALFILCDSFPLQDPEATQKKQDDLMQRQFTAITELLTDASPDVRSVAVAGASKILGLFWELLPEDTIRTLLQEIIGRSARDAASAAVRAEVCSGLKFIANNHLSQPVIGPLMNPATVGHLLHDRSEVVRAACIDLLDFLKTIKAVRFFDVVPLSHLLARLEPETGESERIIRKIAVLLLPTYFPLHKSRGHQMRRMIKLFRTNAPAGIAFFAAIARHRLASANALAKLAEACHKTLVKILVSGESVESTKVKPKRKGRKRKHVKKEVQFTPITADSPLTADESDTLQALLAVQATLMQSLSAGEASKLNTKRSQHLLAALDEKDLIVFFRALSERNDDSDIATRFLLQTAAQLPRASVPELRQIVVGSIMEPLTMQADDESEDALVSVSESPSALTELLHCAFAWGYGASLIRAAATALQQPFDIAAMDLANNTSVIAESPEDESEAAAHRVKIAAVGRTAANAVADNAIVLINAILGHEFTRTRLFNEARQFDAGVDDPSAALLDVVEALTSYFAEAAERFERPDVSLRPSGAVVESTLREAIKCFRSVVLHVAFAMSGSDEAERLEPLSQLIQWSKIHLLPQTREWIQLALNEVRASSSRSTRAARAKRHENDSASKDDAITQAKRVLETTRLAVSVVTDVQQTFCEALALDLLPAGVAERSDALDALIDGVEAICILAETNSEEAQRVQWLGRAQEAILAATLKAAYFVHRETMLDLLARGPLSSSNAKNAEKVTHDEGRLVAGVIEAASAIAKQTAGAESTMNDLLSKPFTELLHLHSQASTLQPLVDSVLMPFVLDAIGSPSPEDVAMGAFASEVSQVTDAQPAAVFILKLAVRSAPVLNALSHSVADYACSMLQRESADTETDVPEVVWKALEVLSVLLHSDMKGEQAGATGARALDTTQVQKAAQRLVEAVEAAEKFDNMAAEPDVHDHRTSLGTDISDIENAENATCTSNTSNMSMISGFVGATKEKSRRASSKSSRLSLHGKALSGLLNRLSLA